jgi:hypothetical protein
MFCICYLSRSSQGYDRVIRSTGFVWDASLYPCARYTTASDAAATNTQSSSFGGGHAGAGAGSASQSSSSSSFSKAQCVRRFGAAPLVDARRKFAVATSQFESINVLNLYVAGALAHGRDFRQSSGGFVHGFRYTVRTLFHALQERNHGVAWPHLAFHRGVARGGGGGGVGDDISTSASGGSLASDSTNVDIGASAGATDSGVRSSTHQLDGALDHMVRRMNEASGLYQMFAINADVLVAHEVDVEVEVDANTDGAAIPPTDADAPAPASTAKPRRQTQTELRYYEDFPMDRLLRLPEVAAARAAGRPYPRVVTMTFEYNADFKGSKVCYGFVFRLAAHSNSPVMRHTCF